MNLSSTARQIVFWLLIIAGALLLYKLVNPRGSTYKTVALTEMDQMIQSGNLKQLTVKQNESVAIDVNNQEYRAALSNEFAKNDLLKSGARSRKRQAARGEGRRRIKQQLYLAHAHHLGATPLHHSYQMKMGRYSRSSATCLRMLRWSMSSAIVSVSHSRVCLNAAGPEEGASLSGVCGKCRINALRCFVARLQRRPADVPAYRPRRSFRPILK